MPVPRTDSLHHSALGLPLHLTICFHLCTWMYLNIKPGFPQANLWSAQWLLPRPLSRPWSLFVWPSDYLALCCQGVDLCYYSTLVQLPGQIDVLFCDFVCVDLRSCLPLFAFINNGLPISCYSSACPSFTFVHILVPLTSGLFAGQAAWWYNLPPGDQQLRSSKLW